MKKAIKISFLILIFIFFCIGSLQKIENSQYKKDGQHLIDNIDDFFKNHQYYPDSINDIDINDNMGNGPYYKKINNSEYVVYFCVGFDKYYVYSSRKREWNYQNSIFNNKSVGTPKSIWEKIGSFLF